jgi:hypothetical protein
MALKRGNSQIHNSVYFPPTFLPDPTIRWKQNSQTPPTLSFYSTADIMARPTRSALWRRPVRIQHQQTIKCLRRSRQTYRSPIAYYGIGKRGTTRYPHRCWVALGFLPDLGGLGALGFITPVVSYGPRGILDVSVGGGIRCCAITLWLRLRTLRTTICILLKGGEGEWKERRQKCEKSDGIMDKHCLFWICRLGHRKRRRDGVLNFLGFPPRDSKPTFVAWL